MWLSDNDGGYSVFLETQTMFDKYMDEGKTYEAWQLAHALMQVVNLNTMLAWASNDLVKNVRCVWSPLVVVIYVVLSLFCLCTASAGLKVLHKKFVHICSC